MAMLCPVNIWLLTKYLNIIYYFPYGFNIFLVLNIVQFQDLKDFFRRVAEVTFADAHRFRTGEG